MLTTHTVIRVTGNHATITVENAADGGYRIRQGSSWLAVDDATLDQILDAIDRLSGDQKPDAEPELGKLFTHTQLNETVTPAKYCAGGRP